MLSLFLYRFFFPFRFRFLFLFLFLFPFLFGIPVSRFSRRPNECHLKANLNLINYTCFRRLFYQSLSFFLTSHFKWVAFTLDMLLLILLVELAELSCSTAMSAKEQKWLPSRRQSYRGNCIKVRRVLYQVPKVCYRDLEKCESQGKWPYWGHRCLETR